MSKQLVEASRDWLEVRRRKLRALAKSDELAAVELQKVVATLYRQQTQDMSFPQYEQHFETGEEEVVTYAK